MADVEKLIHVLHRLVDAGNTRGRGRAQPRRDGRSRLDHRHGPRGRRRRRPRSSRRARRPQIAAQEGHARTPGAVLRRVPARAHRATRRVTGTSGRWPTTWSAGSAALRLAALSLPLQRLDECPQVPRRAARVPDVRGLRHARRQALPRADGGRSERQDAREFLRSLQAARAAPTRHPTGGEVDKAKAELEKLFGKRLKQGRIHRSAPRLELPLSENSFLRTRSEMRSSSFAERRVLLHLHAQMPYPGVVQRLAAAVVDLELARAQDLQRFFERLRRARVFRLHAAAAACSCAPAPRRGALLHGFGARRSPAAARSRRLVVSRQLELFDLLLPRFLRWNAPVAAFVSSSLARPFSAGLTGTTATHANSERT